MKITIEATDKWTEIGGVTCRIWRGVTAMGIECDLAIPLLRVREDANRAQFEEELKAMPAPEDRAVSMRYIW